MAGVNRQVSALAALPALAAMTCALTAHAGSIQFFGTGTNDVDRVKIRIDPHTPADVGAGDFTIEFWIKGSKTANSTGSVRCGNDYGWIDGRILFDRDRLNVNGAFGISVSGAGRIAFGANGNDIETVCGVNVDVLDGVWHHVAVTRVAQSGELALFVDGALEVRRLGGPTGNISYPDGASPAATGCGANGQQSCAFSDPFIVLGAEKHDLAPQSAFTGLIDELRISDRVQYTNNFQRPAQSFTGNETGTVALYHFDETSGDTVSDVKGASPGVRRVIRVLNEDHPAWNTDSPFALSGPGRLQFSQQTYSVTEADGSLTAPVLRVGGADGPASVQCSTTDITAMQPGDYTRTQVMLTWSDNELAPKDCVVPVINDAIAEGNETFMLSLSQQSGATLGTPATATVNLNENAVGGILRFAQATFTVGEDIGTFNVGVTRSSGTTGAISVTVTTQDGSATAGSDYTSASVVLNWNDGETGTKNAAITLINDAAAEGAESFSVSLSGVTGGASIGAPSSATVTINASDSSGGGGGGGGGGAIDWEFLLAGMLALVSLYRWRKVTPARTT